MSKKVTFTTEHDVRVAIEALWSPPSYAVLSSVPNGTGGHKTRTIDALVMSLWPSRGLSLDAVEIKTSRSDWLRELESPAKAETFFEYVDHFWLAVGDADIVREGELPSTWGLLVPSPRGAKMKVAKAAPALTPKPLPRSFLAAMFRRMSEAATGPELRREIADQFSAEYAERMAELAELQIEKACREQRLGQGRLDDATIVREFLDTAGIQMRSWSVDRIRAAARMCKMLVDLGPEALAERLRWQLETLERVSDGAAASAREALAGLSEATRPLLASGPDSPAPADASDPAQSNDATRAL